MVGWARHGLPAGISTLLAFLAGALTNIVTAGWSWPVGVGLGILVAAWVALEMRLAAQATERSAMPRPGAAADAVLDRAVSRVPAVPHQLPAAIPHFSGRAAELAALTELLDSGPEAGTVVISAIGGTAGVGKTALAVHWAHQVCDRFPDGQLYVDLRGFDPAGTPVDPADAVRRFLDAMAVPPQRIPADLDAQAALYRSLLAGKQMLVVLDNARNAEQVRPLLPGSPGSLVLVTSRAPLTGLVAAEGAHPLSLDLLSTVDARELLARRLGVGRIAAEAETANEVVDLCARLPLALAVVAARAATRPDLALDTLAAELRQAQHRLDAFDTSDAVTEVRAVFSWSYRALTPQAARLFRLLGLHPGPDISAPASASLAGLPPTQTRQLLGELTGANLLLESTPGRYTFHDLLRAYAIERAHAIDTDDQRHAATHRTLDHYLHTAYAASWLVNPQRDPIALTPPAPATTPEHPADYAQAMDWFTTEHHVLLAAVDHAALGFDTHVWQLARTLSTYLNRRGHWHDHAIVQHAAVAAARRLADPSAQAHAHRRLAEAYIYLGRYDDAHTHLRDAFDLATLAGDQVAQAHTQHRLSYLWERQGHPAEALEHAQQALSLFLAAGHRVGEARALNAIGWYHSLLGNHEQALTHDQEALALHRVLGDRYGQANTLDSLGYAYHHLGRHAEAVTSFQNALDLRRDLGDTYWEAETLANLGDTHHATGNLDAARTAWQQALTIFRNLDHPDAGQVQTKLEALDTT
jgi:tetratricopeptide (TPR) repeat protein